MRQHYNPYRILGIDESSSQATIERSYNSLTKWLVASKQAGYPGAVSQLDIAHKAMSYLQENEFQVKYNPPPLGFSLDLVSSRNIIERLAEPQVVYVLVTVRPYHTTMTNKTGAIKTGMNLTLVLDHSNSMQGERLERVKNAARAIIERLSENDYLSIVQFNDRANVVVESTPVADKASLISKLALTRASGGTEIYHGLYQGMLENRKQSNQNKVNHIILLTDGNTYGDEELTRNLALQLKRHGIRMSALGLGTEWNDKFLDDISSLAGGNCQFVKNAKSVGSFMDGIVTHLTDLFADRLKVAIAANPDVDLEVAFKLSPSPQVLPHDLPEIPLGGLAVERPASFLLQLQLPANLPTGTYPLIQLLVSADILNDDSQFLDVVNFNIQVQDGKVEATDPPKKIVDALGKMALYNMQEKAHDALQQGDVKQATQRLQRLATRLLDLGEQELADETLREVTQLKKTQMLTEEGRKNLKYHTKHLIESD
ncbi:MAG: vWA domain-containing protein [Phototrophicaceae bacterium]